MLDADVVALQEIQHPKTDFSVPLKAGSEHLCFEEAGLPPGFEQGGVYLRRQ